ncbi:protein of unknown function [Bradyrhizobium vignae]|uniref:Uncharacterized protein n=1 Tax=Bradyrhizobium vignae TaxID=1549949 RepID=A0A2U3PVK5_9BRAD|nr:protein of unknown function [Bradyrhizobium vignae]
MTMSNVSDIQILPAGTDPSFVSLANMFAAKGLTFLISTEASGYDLTPMIGTWMPTAPQS